MSPNVKIVKQSTLFRVSVANEGECTGRGTAGTGGTNELISLFTWAGLHGSEHDLPWPRHVVIGEGRGEHVTEEQ